MLRLVKVEPEGLDWATLDRYTDRTVFQTRQWLAFLVETQRVTPVVAELRDGSRRLGYFTGSIARRFGVSILGSSLRGWTTPYMGFNLEPGVDRAEALCALERFAFHDLRCLHLEILDRYLTEKQGAALGFRSTSIHTYATDLTRSEEDIFSGMSSACRRCIRKAEKIGVTIAEADDEEFAIEYHAQLQEVFARQQLGVPYPLERVTALIRNLLPTGRLLLVRALDPNGVCIATGIFPAFNKSAHFWGNASRTDARHYRPNEAIHWYAMRYWKARGISTYDWGGGGDYKAKYGGEPLTVPWLRKSRYTCLETLRSAAVRLNRVNQRVRGRLA